MQRSLDVLLELGIPELIGNGRSASVTDSARPIGAKMNEDVNSKIERADFPVSYMVQDPVPNCGEVVHHRCAVCSSGSIQRGGMSFLKSADWAAGSVGIA
jgi:predicted RNA-binding Zn-ribbon protein involved in translation (DUF1610 family)